MNENTHEHEEKREFLRVEHETPIEFKILDGSALTSKKDTFSRNISASGILFRTTNEHSIPPLSRIVWIKLDEKMINICSEIEHDLVIYEKGVFGRVVRIAEGEPGVSYDIGICFIRKKDMSEEDIKSLMYGIRSRK